MDTFRIHDGSRASASAVASNKAPAPMPLIDIRLERFEAQVRLLAELSKRADAALNRVLGAGAPRDGQSGDEQSLPNNSLSKLDYALEQNEYFIGALTHQVNRLESL
jgi:hypothetical protein